jgi:hypothetical protein
MSNASNARLVRVATRSWGSSIDSETPLSDGNTRFHVVVEGKAGSVLGASGQPYELQISALDLITGSNPHSAANNFSQRTMERFDAIDGWPEHVMIFTITLNDLIAIQGHLFRYYAILTSANQILSFVESPMFLLYRHDLKVSTAIRRI